MFVGEFKSNHICDDVSWSVSVVDTSDIKKERGKILLMDERPRKKHQT